MKSIVIIGAGDLGKELVWLIEDMNKREPAYLILGFLDDDETKKDSEFCGYKVLGTTDRLEEIGRSTLVGAAVAIQDGTVRKKIVESHPDFHRWESIIHPTAVIASTTSVGIGCIFFPQVTVSVDTELGNFGLYYIHSTICNDCIVGDFVSVMSGASISERAVIGDGCFLAAGSCVNPHKVLGKCVKVGVEAAASKDYGDYAEVNERSGGFFLFK